MMGYYVIIQRWTGKDIETMHYTINVWNDVVSLLRKTHATKQIIDVHISKR